MSTIEVIKYDSVIGDSRLELHIFGDEINYIIMNTLRRIIYTDIPIYAFTNINFDKNTTIYHNNYLRLRISQMPVWGIINNHEILHDNTKNNEDIKDSNIHDNNNNDNNDNDDDIDIEQTKPIDISSLNQLTMYVNYKNKNSHDIFDITTNNALFYYKEKQIENPYSFPIQLVKININQEIVFSAITELGTANKNAIFCAVSVVAYKQQTENDFIFFLESRGQITEKQILLVAIYNIEYRMNHLLKLVKNNNDILKNRSEGKISILNEDHTLGNLITHGLQTHPDISFAGYNIPHPLENTLIFDFKIKSNNIVNIIENVISKYKKLFNNLKNQINKIPENIT